MQSTQTSHYATLGLDRRSTPAEIHAAYRRLARQHHPDLHPGSPAALRRIQELNAAHEILGDPELRRAYDRELDAHDKPASARRAAKSPRNLSQDVHLPLEDFLRGTTRELRVNDPANPDGVEIYELIVPPESAPGARFHLPRSAGGFVAIRVRPLPHFRFKTRGSDLRCNLKIKPGRAAQGGVEMIRGLDGGMLRLRIPVRAARGEIIHVAGEGLPKLRGGRGDLLVRLDYRVEIRITRRRVT